MHFLKKLLANLFRGWEPKLSARDVNESSLLARGVFSKSHLCKGPLRPKPAAFDALFNAAAGRYEASTFCSDRLDDDATKALLKKNAGSRAASMKAMAFSNIRSLPECSLSHDPNWIPYRHVDVVGWDSSREARLSQAQRWAAICVRCVSA